MRLFVLEKNCEKMSHHEAISYIWMPQRFLIRGKHTDIHFPDFVLLTSIKRDQTMPSVSKDRANVLKQG